MPGPITALAIDLDRDTYSRFETAEGRHIVSARVTTTPTDPDAGESVTVELRRRDLATRVVGTATLTYDAATYASGRIAPLDLASFVDADGLPLAIQDEYTVHAYRTNQAAVSATSARFPVMLVTAEEVLDEWVFGLELQAEDTLRPLAPLTAVTGVTITRVSPETVRGSYVLQWDFAGGSGLTWDGGTKVLLGAGNQRRTLVLVGGTRDSGWIMVEVDPPLLPTSSPTTETVVLEALQLDWSHVWPMVRDASAEMETRMGFLLEPEVIVTRDPDSASEVYDRIDEPVQYSKPARPLAVRQIQPYVGFEMPHVYVQRLERLRGYLNTQRVLDVDASWYTVNRDTGSVDFVPATGAVLTWQLTGQALLFFSFQNPQVPRFWHYRMVAGIDPLPGDIRECVARTAAIKTLVRAGQGFKSGIASESISRDGISESRSYTSSAVYGVYSASIESHRKWLRHNVGRVRARHAGLVTVGRR